MKPLPSRGENLSAARMRSLNEGNGVVLCMIQYFWGKVVMKGTARGGGFKNAGTRYTDPTLASLAGHLLELNIVTAKF